MQQGLFRVSGIGDYHHRARKRGQRGLSRKAGGSILSSRRGSILASAEASRQSPHLESALLSQRKSPSILDCIWCSKLRFWVGACSGGIIRRLREKRLCCLRLWQPL